MEEWLEQLQEQREEEHSLDCPHAMAALHHPELSIASLIGQIPGEVERQPGTVVAEVDRFVYREGWG